MAFNWPIANRYFTPAERPQPNSLTARTTLRQRTTGKCREDVLLDSYLANHGAAYIQMAAQFKCRCLISTTDASRGMLSSTRNIYSQTFAAPRNILLQKAQTEHFEPYGKVTAIDDKMLLVQPHKRSRATFDHDHACSHPASWQVATQHQPIEHRGLTNAVSPSSTVIQSNLTDISKVAIAALSLEQLQDLSAQISDRIQVKKRYNNTPLRRIIARQVSDTPSPSPAQSEEDTFSQTDTLVNSEVIDVPRESSETIQARYNSTPLRRILARQVSADQGSISAGSISQRPQHEAEPLEVRKARYNDTPLRRILSRQASVEQPQWTANIGTSPTFSPVFQRSTSTPVPRSNTPLRRILSRQASTQISPSRQKDDDELSDRADSVISPDPPVLSNPSRQPSAFVELSSEVRIRAYETALWGLSKPTAPPAPREQFNSEARVRAYEETIWAKSATPFQSPQEKSGSKETTITVMEVTAEAKKPKRIVVDSKGSPLRRILKRQTSRDWKAPARVGVA